jgi:DNA-binding GntR family transcriptional regulator
LRGTGNPTDDTMTALGPVKKAPTIGDKVYGQLEHALMAGRFAPGQRLVTRSVAASMNVSPTPVREALNRLVSSRALRMDENRVYCVSRLTPEQLDELYKIRLALEGMATEEATRRMDDATLSRLRAIHAQMTECVEQDDRKAALHHNRAFHFALYDAAAMPILGAKIRQCWVLIGSHFNLLYPEHGRRRSGLHHHQTVIEAVAAGDPRAARTAVESDLRQSHARLRASLIETDAAAQLPFLPITHREP